MNLFKSASYYFSKSFGKSVHDQNSTTAYYPLYVIFIILFYKTTIIQKQKSQQQLTEMMQFVHQKQIGELSTNPEKLYTFCSELGINILSIMQSLDFSFFIQIQKANYKKMTRFNKKSQLYQYLPSKTIKNICLSITKIQYDENIEAKVKSFIKRFWVQYLDFGILNYGQTVMDHFIKYQQQFGLNQSDICHIIQKLQDEKKDSQNNSVQAKSQYQRLLKICLQKYKLKIDQVDYTQLMKKKISMKISHCIFSYFKDSDDDFYNNLKRTLTEKADIIQYFKKLIGKEQNLIKFIDSLFETQKLQCLSITIKRVLSIILIINSWMDWPGAQKQNLNLKEIIDLSFKKLLYFMYNRKNSMGIVKIICFWLEISNQKIRNIQDQTYNKPIVEHLKIIIQIKQNIYQECGVKNKYQQQFIKRIKNLVHNRLKSYQACRKSLEISSKQIVKDSKNKINRIDEKIRKSVKRLQYESIYHYSQQLGQLILANKDIYSQEQKKVLLKTNSSILASFQKIALRSHCQIIVDKIIQSIQSYIHVICTQRNQSEIIDKFQYINLDFRDDCSERGQWGEVLRKILKSNVRHQFPLRTIYKLNLLKQKIQNEQIITFKKQRESFKSIDSESLILYSFDQILYSHEKMRNIISQLLGLKQEIITNSIYVNLVFWVFYRQTTKRSKRSKQFSQKSLPEKSVKKILENLFGEKFKFLLQPLNQTFYYTVLNAQQHIKIWQKKSDGGPVNSSIKSYSEQYFTFLTQFPEHYQNFSCTYKKNNQLKYAAYFKQLLYYHTRKSMNKQSLQKIQIDLIDIYSRLNPQFSYLKTKMKEKIMPNLQILQNHQKYNQNDLNHRWIQMLNQMVIISRKQRKSPYLIKTWTTYLIKILVEQIVELRQNSEINQIYLKIKICRKLVMIIWKQQNIQDKECKILHKEINLIKQPQEKIKILHILYQINKSKDNQMKYWESLYQAGYYRQLQKLMSDKINKKDQIQLRMQILINLKQENYSKVLYEINLLEELLKKTQHQQISETTREEIRTQMRYHKIQAKYFFYSNLPLNDVVSLIRNCIQKLKIFNNQSTSYILKMFRLIFDKYHILEHQNYNVIEMLCSYIQSLKNSKNQNIDIKQSYITEGLFYLLRFLLQKINLNHSEGNQVQKKIEQLIKIALQDLKYLKPHLNYLIRRISQNQQRNTRIYSIIKRLAKQYFLWSTWWVASLKRHKVIRQKLANVTFTKIDNKLQQLGIDIFEDYQKSKLDIKGILWVEKFINLALNPQNKNPKFLNDLLPRHLISPFNERLTIKYVSKIQNISEGKSRPLKITMNLEDQNNHQITIIYILKYNPCKDYRIQSNTANFFKQINIIDKESTYQILQLTKYIQLIQEVKNQGTFKNTILKFHPKQEIEEFVNCPSTFIYDQMINKLKKIELNLHSLVFKVTSINQWWDKFNNYCRSNAQWSFIGYVVGLGDRHYDNILVSLDGRVVHIDFQYNLDCAKNLPVPELVPFRLTTFIKEVLGGLDSMGLFYSYMVQTAKDFNQKQRSVWKALSYFYCGEESTVMIEKILSRANFRNKKTLEDGCLKLIQQAEDEQILKPMYHGWKPFL